MGLKSIRGYQHGSMKKQQQDSFLKYVYFSDETPFRTKEFIN